MQIWKLTAPPSLALALLFTPVLPGPADAQGRCAFMEPSGPGRGSTPGRYWNLVNNCRYNVVFQFSAGWFGGGYRDHSPFLAAGRSTRMFIPNPQPHRYNVSRR